MANALYPLWKENVVQLGANYGLNNAALKAALVKSTYTYSAAHQFYSDLTPASNVAGTPVALATKTYTGGLLKAANTTITAVPSGGSVTAIVLYNDTGTSTTSPLVAYIDTGVTGFPVSPNGGDITIAWNASGIFQL